MLPIDRALDVQGFMSDDLRYPIGEFTPAGATADVIAAAISDIERLPVNLRAAVQGLNADQLETPYRPGGWTVRQLVHHLADSHLNGLTRTKLALTEDNPTIKPYDENAWALLADTRLPIDVSLKLIDQLHARWVAVFRSMTASQFQRTFVHPEHSKTMTVGYHVQDYAWHGRHHVAHITALRQREGW
jgi:hypothetical protein